MTLTIAQLQDIVAERKSYAEDLQRRLAKVIEELTLIEEDLAKLEGGKGKPKRKPGRKKAVKAAKGKGPSKKKTGKRGRPPGKKKGGKFAIEGESVSLSE